MRRVEPQVRPFQLWGLLGAEALLVAVAAWYVSGLEGLASLGQRTLSDVAASLGWGVAQAELPQPAAGDLFLLILAGLLAVLSLWHLALLARQPLRSR